MTEADLQAAALQWRARSAMTIDVDGVVEDGVIKPERPLGLKEKTKVHVTIHVQEEGAPAKDDDPTGWKAIDGLMGIGKAVAPDVSEKHDDYLYGNSRD